MLSRVPLSFLIALLSLSFTLGCNLKTGDWVEANDRGRLSYTCLADLDSEVRDFIDGELDASQVAITMDCVRKALDEFSHIGRGSSKGGFKAEELSNFLNLKFLGSSKITPDFLKELMQVKVVIAGGSDQFVSKEEFKRLISLIGIIEDEAARLAPYMKIYRNTMSKDQVSDDMLNTAKDRLNRTAANLAELLKSPSGVYKLSSLRGLIDNSRKFLKWEQETPESGSLDELMENLEVFKIFAAGSEQKNGEEVILPSNWVHLLGTFSQSYGIYLDYLFRLDGANYTAGEGLREIIRTAEKVKELIVSVIQHQKEPFIEFSLVDRILAQMQKMGVIPDYLRLKESVQATARYFIEKIMRDLSIPLSKAKSKGLRISHIREIENEFLIWADGQRYIERLYKKSGKSHTQDLGVFMSQLDDDLTSAGELEISNLLEGPGNKEKPGIEPFYNGSGSRVWVADSAIKKKNGLEFTQNFDSLTRLNVIKVFARLLIRGFAEEPRRAKNVLGITEKEAGDFYRHAKDLGQDLEYMDKRKSNVGARFFKEANLFTFSANGIFIEQEGSDRHLLSFHESIEQLALVYSGSLLRSDIYESSLEHCSNFYLSMNQSLARDKVFGKTMIPKECMLKKLVAEDYQKFANLPGMLEFFNQVGVAGRREFFNSMFEISRPPCTDGSMVEFGELATLSTLAHYIEVVFKKFDTNMNGTLDGREVMNAYSSFRGFMVPEVRRITNLKWYKKSFNGDSEDRAEFLEDLEDSLRDLENDFKLKTHQRKVSMGTYKIVLQQFDLNSNNRIDGVEIVEAYVSNPDLIDLSVAVSLGIDVEEQRVKAIFAFLLSEGRSPDPNSLSDGFDILAWEFNHFNEDPHQYEGECKKSWYYDECSVPDDIQVDRNSIMQVLGLLAESAGGPTCEGDPLSKGEQLNNSLQNLSLQPGHGLSILPKMLDSNSRKASRGHKTEKPAH